MQPKHHHVGHRERLKDRFNKVGLDGFQDHEVLEYLLTFAIPQKDVNPLAHELIDHFGCLNGVLDAEEIELSRVKGIGAHASSLLRLVPQLSQRYLNNPAADNRVNLSQVKIRKDYFIPKFVGKSNECLFVAYMNSNWEVLACRQMAEGSISTVRFESRKMLDAAIRYRATTAIIAHNHFSSTTPSFNDITATQDIARRFDVCGIKLLDHVIVCRNYAISLSETGQMRHVTCY